jgi:hypothetical protein
MNVCITLTSNIESSRFPLMPQNEIKSFAQFWPHYVADHQRPATRVLHLIGTTVGIACAVLFIVQGRWWLFPLALIPAYSAAWVGHFFVEHNKPASFQHPLWSFIGDYKMIGLMLMGKMRDEVERVRRTP